MRSLYLVFLSMVIGLSACQPSEVETQFQEPATESLTSQKQLSSYHLIFQPILAELQNTTKIPLSLPTYIPEYDRPNSLYALIEQTTASEYSILLAFTEDCMGGTACRLGSVSGKKINAQNSNLNGQEITLINNVTGYFTDAVCGANCSDSTLSWVQNNTYYTVALQGGKPESLVKMANSAISPNKTVKSSSNTIAEELLISATGIGKAKLGMTLGELKKVLSKDAEFKTESPFMVDINAVSVVKNGVVQYYILYPTGTTLSDSEPITNLMTQNDNYRTKEEIGVGTTLKQAEAKYGKATLSFNTSYESREYVKFANQPAKNIRFRPLNETGFAGIYPLDVAEYNETQEFKSDATINYIEVFCMSQNCTSE